MQIQERKGRYCGFSCTLPRSRGHSTALQCALCQATRWPAGFLSVPLQLAPPANLHAVGNHKNPNISSSLRAAAASCYMHREENHCAKQSDNSSHPKFQAVQFDALR